MTPPLALGVPFVFGFAFVSRRSCGGKVKALDTAGFSAAIGEGGGFCRISSGRRAVGVESVAFSGGVLAFVGFRVSCAELDGCWFFEDRWWRLLIKAVASSVDSFAVSGLALSRLEPSGLLLGGDGNMLVPMSAVGGLTALFFVSIR